MSDEKFSASDEIYEDVLTQDEDPESIHEDPVFLPSHINLSRIKSHDQVSKTRYLLGDNVNDDNTKGWMIKEDNVRVSMLYGLTNAEREKNESEGRNNEAFKVATKKLLDMYMSSLNTMELSSVKANSLSIDQLADMATINFTKAEFCKVMGIRPRSIRNKELKTYAQVIQMYFRLRVYNEKTKKIDFRNVFSKCGYSENGSFFYFTLNIADKFVRKAFFGGNGRFDNYFKYTISDIAKTSNRTSHPYNLLVYLMNKCPSNCQNNYFEFDDHWENIKYCMEVENEKYKSISDFRKLRLAATAKALKEENIFDIKTYIPVRGSGLIRFEVQILPGCSRYRGKNANALVISEDEMDERKELLKNPVLERIVQEAEELITALDRWNLVDNKKCLYPKDLDLINDYLNLRGEDFVRQTLNYAIKTSKKSIMGLFKYLCVSAEIEGAAEPSLPEPDAVPEAMDYRDSDLESFGATIGKLF